MKESKKTPNQKQGRVLASKAPDVAIDEPPPPDEIFARAVSLHLEGKRKEALDELDRALHAGKGDPEIHAARGRVQFELERYEEAAASYLKIAKGCALEILGRGNGGQRRPSG